MKKWITLFSQTGSEVVDLALHFDRWPDIIVTNNSDESKWHPQIRKLHERGLSGLSGKSRIKVVSNFEAKTANFLPLARKYSAAKKLGRADFSD